MDHQYEPYVSKLGTVHLVCGAAIDGGFMCGKPEAAHVQTGDVMASHVTLDLPPDTTAITVCPDEVLVIRSPHILNRQQVDQHRQTIEGALGPNRYVLLMGDWQLSKVAVAGPEVEHTIEATIDPGAAPRALVRPEFGLTVLDADKLKGPPAHCVTCGQATTEYCAHCRVPACPLHDRIRGLGGGSFVHIRPAPRANLPCEPDTANAWRPGDPCAGCGSTDTHVVDREAVCRACGRMDGDET